jgi:hypothetical protein
MILYSDGELNGMKGQHIKKHFESSMYFVTPTKNYPRDHGYRAQKLQEDFQCSGSNYSVLFYLTAIHYCRQQNTNLLFFQSLEY